VVTDPALASAIGFFNIYHQMWESIERGKILMHYETTTFIYHYKFSRQRKQSIAILGHLGAFYGGSVGYPWWRESCGWCKQRGAGQKVAGKSCRKIHTTGVQADREGGFGSIFKALADPVKSRHELGFIVDIAIFPLAQKSGNLMMF